MILCSGLTILCVTQREECTADLRSTLASDAWSLGARYIEFDGSGAGVIEDVLDRAIVATRATPGMWILRLDDDERISQPMWGWLASGAYREHDHWAFSRLNLWPDADSHIASNGLWPDYQTRLSTVEKSGGRTHVHDGSPYGTGEIAPVAIEHHKFLIRDVEDRRRILAGYEALGADAGHRAFSVPEDCAELDVRSRLEVAA